MLCTPAVTELLTPPPKKEKLQGHGDSTATSTNIYGTTMIYGNVSVKRSCVISKLKVAHNVVHSLYHFHNLKKLSFNKDMYYHVCYCIVASCCKDAVSIRTIIFSLHFICV